MINIVIKNKDANEAMEMVRDLRSQGYKQGTDFDFKSSPGNWDNFSGAVIPKQTTFIFYNDKLATWFTLKWA